MQLYRLGKRFPKGRGGGEAADGGWGSNWLVVMVMAMILAAVPVPDAGAQEEPSCDGWCALAIFDDYANGSLHTQGPWHVNREGATDGAHASDDVPVVFSGKTMVNQLAGRPPTQYRGNAYAALGDLAIDEGATGTLFVEFLTAELDATALNIGLSANDAPGLGADDTGNELDLNDYEVQLTFDERGFVIRDGAAERVIDNVAFEANQLYAIWFVVDNDSDTYQVQIAAGDEPAVAAESGGVDRFAFRNGTNASLVTYLHVNDPDDPPTANSYIDNIFLNPTAPSLDNPGPAFDEVVGFDDYEVGDLTGQDGWEATASVTVTGDPTEAGWGDNLALDAPVEVSSVLRAGAEGEKAVDGQFTDDSRWISAEEDAEPWIVIDLGAPADLAAAAVYSGYQATNNDPSTTLKDFIVEVRTEDGWQQVAEVTDNVEHKVTVADLDIQGDQVRLLISDPSGNSLDVARVFEIEVYEQSDEVAGNRVVSMPEPGLQAYRPIPAIPDGETGTIFFRMFRTDLVDTSLGLSPVDAPQAFGDFEVQANNQNSPTLNARDGGGFSAAGTWAEGVWQCVWMVADNQSDSYRMYSRGGPYEVTTRLPVDEETLFAFRNGATEALDRFFAINGATNPGTVFVDDMAIDTGGMNLRVPGGDEEACVTADVGDQPVDNPIPQAPVDSDVGLVLEEFATMPPAQDTSPMARINFLGEVPDGSGRLFVPDLYGTLHLLVDGEPVEYLDVAGEFDDFVSAPGLGTGFGFVAFHPEFATNGLFYTVHTEAGNALGTETPDLPSPEDAAIHGVITEWTATDPAADTFAGSRRELLRIGYHTTLHGFQQIGFNPTAQPGDEDYGLLYLSSGDGERVPNWTDGPQNPGVPQGKILRIDPLGSNSANGQYGIPASNPFVNDPDALGEVFALGVRNPHRFSWDPTDGRMFLGHIGEQSIDSIYEVEAGDNFGWNEREGSYRFDKSDPANVYPLPDDDDRFGFTYPVAELDNPRDGRSLVGGFVYRGDAAPELDGKYVFGDILTGTIRYTDAADMQRGEPRAQVYDLALVDEAGEPLELPDGPRGPDIRLGRDGDGELYVLSKTTGRVWKVTGARRFAGCEVGDTTVTDVMDAGDWAPVTPEKWEFPGEEVVLVEPGEERPGPRRPFEYAVLTAGPVWGSVQLDAEVRVDVPTPVGRDVIIVFGHQSDTEFYYAHLSEDDASFPHNGIFVVNNADRERIDDQWDGGTGAPPAIAPGTNWHQVRVVHCPDTGEIAVYTDGSDIPLMTATDTTFEAGRVGFGSFDDVGRIRGLTVTGTGVDTGPCPRPDERPTVVVGDQDSGVDNRVLEDGCTINDLILDEADWDDKGAFLRHVDQVVRTLRSDGVIDGREAAAIRLAAARSEIGRP